MRGVELTGMEATSTSMSIATLILITISTATKPNRNYRKEDSLIKKDRESGSIIRSTAREFLIGTREQQKNSTEQVPVTRSSHGRSFADGRSRGDKTLPEAESETAEALATKEELAIVEVWEIAVVLATVEGQVIEVARVNSVATAGSVEAVPETGAAPLRASIAVGVPREAPASAAARVEGVLVVADPVEVVEDEGGGGKEVSSDECRVRGSRDLLDRGRNDACDI